MLRAFLVMLILLTTCSTTVRGDSPPGGKDAVITEFDEPFNFAYLGFEKSVEVKRGVAHLMGKKSQGGAGVIKALDLSSLGDHSPAIWAKVGPTNRAEAFKMFFSSGESRRMFTYSLKDVGQDSFVRLLPEDALAVAPSEQEPDQDFDPGKINTFQVQGDWSGKPIDVYIDKIELVPPTPEMLASREAHAERLAKMAERKRREEEQRRQEIQRLLANSPHPADGPSVDHVYAVKSDTIALTINSGRIVPQRQVPYREQAGDEITYGKQEHNVLAWEHGRIVDTPKDCFLKRKVAGQNRVQQVGALVGNEDLLAPGPAYEGTPLSTITADHPEAYRIASGDDPAYAEPRAAAAVYVKGKPTGNANNQMPLTYQVYLQLPSPLREGATYRLQMRGINTRQASVDYTHEPRRVRSEAIHVNQIGYRPDDPIKRAYLSLWMGTGGAVRYDVDTFELLRAATGQTVYRGDIKLGFAAERKESLRGDKNHTKTNVYYLDFHDFSQAGEFVVHVPGIGVSYPFTIGDDVWRQAFEVSMHGFLSHRSGIELGPPFTDYRRPRPMHPDDGTRVFELDITYWNGEAASVLRCLRRLLGPELDPARVREYPDAWGGYMDAGDWDRRSQHLSATWVQLELLDLFPDYYEALKLALPPSEANDHLPDVLNEALWNLDLYRRLQREDGGVGGGVESTAHPRAGEASWQESLLLGTFAPDPETSLRYAASAARTARLIAKYDPGRAATYRDSALRAWAWANANEERVVAAEAAKVDSRGGRNPAKLAGAVRDVRALAAVALYRLTGDLTFHDAFRQATTLVGDGDPGSQMYATFAYALLPDDSADPDLKQKAIAWYEQAAEDSMVFARANAFNLTCRVPMLPLIGYVAYYSVPETTIGSVLPRAHYLTGKREYLCGALAAAHFSAGANPMNMTFTTGVGHQYPQHPLHVDSQHAGIDPPRGITVYGMGDPAVSDGAVDWVHTWFLNKTMVPGSRTWPAAESYIDLGNWPSMNEYTVHQTFRPTCFYWGYLAARQSIVER